MRKSNVGGGLFGKAWVGGRDAGCLGVVWVAPAMAGNSNYPKDALAFSCYLCSSLLAQLLFSNSMCCMFCAAKQAIAWGGSLFIFLFALKCFFFVFLSYQPAAVNCCLFSRPIMCCRYFLTNIREHSALEEDGQPVYRRLVTFFLYLS